VAYKKGQCGNPNGRPSGRTAGARIRQAIEGRADELINAIMQQALNGDMAAAKILIDRVCPVLKPSEQPIVFDLVDDDKLLDVAQTLLNAVSRGELRPEDCEGALDMVRTKERLQEIAKNKWMFDEP
jgi:hypothetical protein